MPNALNFQCASDDSPINAFEYFTLIESECRSADIFPMHAILQLCLLTSFRALLLNVTDEKLGQWDTH